MSTVLITVLIAVVLLLQGLGHGGAMGALITIDRGVLGGKWLTAKSWLFPKHSPQTAKTIAIIFWVLFLLDFVAAALAFWGIPIPGDLWRPLAVVFALISFIGIVIFWGRWPIFNTMAAQAVNLAVLSPRSSSTGRRRICLEGRFHSEWMILP